MLPSSAATETNNHTGKRCVSTFVINEVKTGVRLRMAEAEQHGHGNML